MPANKNSDEVHAQVGCPTDEPAQKIYTHRHTHARKHTQEAGSAPLHTGTTISFALSLFCFSLFLSDRQQKAWLQGCFCSSVRRKQQK